MSQESTVSILPTHSSTGVAPLVSRLPPADVGPLAPGVHNMNSATVVELEGGSCDHDGGGSSDEDGKGGVNGKSGGKSRRELPAGAVATLKAWLLSPEHFTHPYPTPQDQILLMQKTGIDKKQLKNWFTNARRRIWKPMLKKQLEAGKLAATGAGGGGVAMAGLVPGVMFGGSSGTAPPPPVFGAMAPPSFPSFDQTQAQPIQHPGMKPGDNMYSNFQQVLQQQPSHQQLQQPPPLPQVQHSQQAGYDYGSQGYQQQQHPYQTYGQQQPAPNEPPPASAPHMAVSNSIGSLPPMQPSAGSTASLNANNMYKTDSHAVLMELFARDQDLVRQAAGRGVAGAPPPLHQASVGMHSAGMQQPSHVSSLPSAPPPGGVPGQPPSLLSAPATAGAAAQLLLAGRTGAASARVLGQRQQSVTFERVPMLNSWPHFSSVSSLSNLGGTLAGVKSITNLSAADLSSQGNLNKMGNLAQVKSIENMGRGDSFAFLEVFFDDKSGLSSGSNGLTSGGGIQRGVKRERDEDDAIGLSLDGDEGSSPTVANKPNNTISSDGKTPSIVTSSALTPATLLADKKDDESDGGKLKRAYDDALAARGLIAVRRSCEKLTDLALPAKMQKTLSQEYVRQHNQGQSVGNFFSSAPSAPPSAAAALSSNHMGGGGSNCAYLHRNSGSPQQYPAQQQSAQPPMAYHNQMNASVAAAASTTTDSLHLADPNMTSTSIEVPSTTECALCHQINVDTQLRPCGHMFHGRCLKPSLQNALGPPKCPIDHTPMQSAVLAVPSASAEEKQAPVSV